MSGRLSTRAAGPTTTVRLCCSTCVIRCFEMVPPQEPFPATRKSATTTTVTPTSGRRGVAGNFGGAWFCFCCFLCFFVTSIMQGVVLYSFILLSTKVWSPRKLRVLHELRAPRAPKGPFHLESSRFYARATLITRMNLITLLPQPIRNPC